MLFLHCFPWWPRCWPTRNRGPHRGPQASEHERSVAITEGNRTSRVSAEPSAAECASELGLLHHSRAARYGSSGRQPRSLPVPCLRPGPGWTCPMWRQPEPAPTPRTSKHRHQYCNGGGHMRRCLAVLATATAATFIGAPAAFACGGLVAPNGAVKLVNTTTLVAYHDGVEHYVTSFEYAGGGTRFGSIIPLPGVPTSVTRGGSWTLQRLELEVHPPAPEAVNGAASAASTVAGPAHVLLRTHVNALTITVVKGGGPAVTAWVRQQGFKVSPDLPGHAQLLRSPQPHLPYRYIRPCRRGRPGPAPGRRNAG